MRMPNIDNLSARIEAHDKEPKTQDHVGGHINALADKLGEAYEVVTRLNKISREKQKARYDKNTKLVTFSEGDNVYLKEMTIGVGKSKKFQTR
jgi:predicted transcriptional regulator